MYNLLFKSRAEALHYIRNASWEDKAKAVPAEIKMLL